MKACRILRARLAPLGTRIVCRSNLPDTVIDGIAADAGCVVVTTDAKIWRLKRRACWVVIPSTYAATKSARDLATHILKLAARQCIIGPDEPAFRAVTQTAV